jgi:ubiquinone/menaquinone biosynthesis C-methylase UbiE
MNGAFTNGSGAMFHNSVMPLVTNSQLNFGYPWWLSYGHLPFLAAAAGLLLLGYARKWSKLPMLLLGVFALWSGAALFIARFMLDVNGRATLPTQTFLASGTGRVLDLGAGTGRSTIMVLESRPRATMVALDLFGDSFERHFGPSQTPQQKLLANLQAAGVGGRATIQTGDMRKLPFEPGSFDAAVSAYAVDHLDREGIGQALAEAHRVVKPGVEFLLILIANEPWIDFAFGPVLMHGHLHGPDWWTARLQEAGFQVFEKGTRPGTLYLLANVGQASRPILALPTKLVPR